MKLTVAFALLFLFLVPALRPALARPDRPAEKGVVGVATHLTLAPSETKDIALSLPKGDYVIQADLKLTNEQIASIQMSVDLLKTNGVLVEGSIVSANTIHRVARVARVFHVLKPLAARLRVKNDSKPMEFWITVVPATKRSFLPFAFGDGDLKPLGIGEANGKGGTLAKGGTDGFYAFHKLTLPAGKYDISLYLKQSDGMKGTLQGDLTLLDSFGAADKSDWNLNVNEIDIETRKEKRLVLLKPTTILLLVTNTNTSHAYEYTVGIEKTTE